MYKILITDSLSPAGLKILEDTEGVEPVIKSGLTSEEVREALQEADGIIIRSGTKLTPEVLDGQKRLKVIVRAGVGVDNVNLTAATRAGIVVMNTPAGNTTSTAEHALAMMMAMARNIAPAAASMKEGRWDRKSYTGTQLSGKTLGVVGLGRIGLSVAQRAIALGMTVVGYDPFFSDERAREYGIEYSGNVDEILPRCDFVTVHTPLNDQTRGLINAQRLASMKKGVRLVNCARGGIIDEDDLADAIESGHVAGAALDVFTKEPPENRRLIDLPQVLATPHLGASTEEAQEGVAVEAAEIITGFLLRNEIRYAINMAPISASEMEAIRLYLDLAYRLGRMVGELTRGETPRSAKVTYRGDAKERKTSLLTSAFTVGLLQSGLSEAVNIVNATADAEARGLTIISDTSNEKSNFSTMISASLTTDGQTLEVAGTIFGNEFLRLVRFNNFALEAFLDGLLLIFRHRDVPGLIGYIGTIFGETNVNIAQMALGRAKKEPGGESVAVLNLDNRPSEEAIARVLEHPEVIGVQLVQLPPADNGLPWLVNG